MPKTSPGEAGWKAPVRDTGGNATGLHSSTRENPGDGRAGGRWRTALRGEDEDATGGASFNRSCGLVPTSYFTTKVASLASFAVPACATNFTRYVPAFVSPGITTGTDDWYVPPVLSTCTSGLDQSVPPW